MARSGSHACPMKHDRRLDLTIVRRLPGNGLAGPVRYRRFRGARAWHQDSADRQNVAKG